MRKILWGKNLNMNNTEILPFCHCDKAKVLYCEAELQAAVWRCPLYRVLWSCPLCSSCSFPGKWMALRKWRYFSNTISVIFALPFGLSASSGSWFIEHKNCKGPKSSSNIIPPYYTEKEKKLKESARSKYQPSRTFRTFQPRANHYLECATFFFFILHSTSNLTYWNLVQG